MIRPDSELHQVAAAQWSQDKAYRHLSDTFDLAANHRPDLFEPYLIRLADAEQDERAQMTIMREALRDTFTTRYPNRFARPDVGNEGEPNAEAQKPGTPTTGQGSQPR